MANNRLYLVYRPTGQGLFLGSRLASGWGRVADDLSEQLRAFFEHVEATADAHPHVNQDDFALFVEKTDRGEQLPGVHASWKYAKTETSDDNKPTFRCHRLIELPVS